MQVTTYMRKSLYMGLYKLYSRKDTFLKKTNRTGAIEMKKIALILITLTIFIIGMSCASAAAVKKGETGSLLKIQDSHADVKKVSLAKAAKKTSKKSKKSSKKLKKAVKSKRNVNSVINGWDPKKHEVSRISIGGGLTRITYDDGYFRIVDSNGNILSYGF